MKDCYSCTHYGGWGGLNMIKCNRDGKPHKWLGCDDWEEPGILPCPFCGTSVRIRPIQLWFMSLHNDVKKHWICPGENAYLYADTYEEAVKLWNTRRGEPKKMCANCKYWKNCEDGWGPCDHQESANMKSYKESCEDWEADE